MITVGRTNAGFQQFEAYSTTLYIRQLGSEEFGNKLKGFTFIVIGDRELVLYIISEQIYVEPEYSITL